MHHKFPVLTVKKLLKSVYIYGSYRKNKTGVPFFLEQAVQYDFHVLSQVFELFAPKKYASAPLCRNLSGL